MKTYLSFLYAAALLPLQLQILQAVPGPIPVPDPNLPPSGFIPDLQIQFPLSVLFEVYLEAHQPDSISDQEQLNNMDAGLSKGFPVGESEIHGTTGEAHYTISWTGPFGQRDGAYWSLVASVNPGYNELKPSVYTYATLSIGGVKVGDSYAPDFEKWPRPVPENLGLGMLFLVIPLLFGLQHALSCGDRRYLLSSGNRARPTARISEVVI